MQLQIASSEFAMTETVETHIHQQVKALEDYVNGLTGCTRCLQHLRFIVIAKAGRARIHLDVPGKEITIDKRNSVDLSSAIDEAFAATRIKLEEYVHKVRHDLKAHEPSPDVRVTTIFKPDGYGFLESLDGREVYFRRSRFTDARVGA
ncbi:MAG: HPF/RaiA family ribosome-associated protein [Candidatus Binataceae bacterium]